MEEKTKEKRIELSMKIIISIFLSIWCIIPFLQTIGFTFMQQQYSYMKIVGLIGIYFLVLYIIKNLYKKESKKEFCIKILPIFIFCAYMIWTLVSCIFSEDLNKAFYGTEYRKEGYITYLAYAGFFSLAFLLDSSKCKKWILNIFLLVAVVNCIIIQIATNNNFTKILMTSDITNGVFYNSNHYGYYLLLVTACANFLFITEEKKYLKMSYLLSYAFLLYYLILNNTFGVYLAIGIALIAFLIYCLYRKKKIYGAIISIIIFVLMSCIVQTDGKNVAFKNISDLKNDINKIASVISKDESNNYDNESKEQNIQNENTNVITEKEQKEFQKVGTGRMRLWINGAKFFIKNPLLGYGPENLEAKYAEVDVPDDRPHNLILQLATTSGLPGLLLYLSAVRNYYNKSI